MHKARTAQDLDYVKGPRDRVEAPIDIISKLDVPQTTYPFATRNSESYHLVLESFKTERCSIAQEHNRIKCPFYHSPKDYRRNASYIKYSSFMCPFSRDGRKCPAGDYCKDCHNSVELNYHPNNYKRRFCIFFPDNLDKCKFGEFCSYAHSEQDILAELIHNYNFDQDFFMFHYKTSFCPINHIQHDRSLCVYSHNWQDYRRKPNKYFIQAEVCPDWNNSKVILNYEEGCPRGKNCYYCHGWKEPEFHPFVYKTKKCESTKDSCPRLNACPYYHSEAEQRVTQGLFKLFQSNQVFGLNEKNQYCKQKNDEVRYQNLIMSMTSVNLKPVIKNTLESMMDLKPPQPKQGADGFQRGQRNVPFSHQVIAEVSLSMPSIKEIKE